MPRLYLIELFAGTHSVSSALKRSAIGRDYDIKLLSVDMKPEFNPTVVADINTWRFRGAIDHFLSDSKHASDIVAVWASPPCAEFSTAKNGRPRDMEAGNRNVRSALRIIQYVNSHDYTNFFWFIENPVGLLKEQPYMRAYETLLNTTTYCKWGFLYKKPTNIWSNVELNLPACTTRTPCKHMKEYGRHPVRIEGRIEGGDLGFVRILGGGEKAYAIPPGLVRHLFKRGLASIGE